MSQSEGPQLVLKAYGHTRLTNNHSHKISSPDC